MEQSWLCILCATLVGCGASKVGVSGSLGERQVRLNSTALPTSLLESIVTQGVPRPLATLAIDKYNEFSGFVRNSRYLSIVDFTQHSFESRLYLVNTESGLVDKILVAHGEGSDPTATGLPQYFSNRINSKMSSVGAYIANERTPSAKHGTTIRLDGLEASNTNARVRNVIIHSAVYVKPGQIKQGMSWGCPAVPVEWIDKVLDRLSDGSFLYAYGVGRTDPKLVTPEFGNGQVINPGAPWIEDGADAPVEGVW